MSNIKIEVITEPSSTPNIERSTKRRDIQLLRAFAVSVVFLYHLDLYLFHGGFIGVDSFFVISGFLVFSPILSNFEQFSFVGFLCRRIKRLTLPSCITLTVLCLFLLLSGHCEHGTCGKLFEDTQAAALHYANIHYIVEELGYFKSTNGASIVLHYWSLAVEEQIYLVIPMIFAALYFITRRFFNYVMFPFIFAVSLASFALIFIQSPAIKFFFFTSRLWEFMAGAALVLVPHKFIVWRDKFKISFLAVYIASWMALLACSMLVFGVSYPNIFTVPVITCTSFIILCNYEYTVPVLETLGNASYSVYLYHWPIIQILKYYYRIYSISVPLWIPAVLGTAMCATLSYQLVELPIQRSKWPKRTVAVIFFIGTLFPAMLAFCGVQITVLQNLQPTISSPILLASSNTFNGTYPWYKNNTYELPTLVDNSFKVGCGLVGCDA